MDSKNIYRISGWLGILACIITFAEFPLWMVGGMVPVFSDSTAFATYVSHTGSLWITRTLMDFVIYNLLLVFLAGFRRMAIDHYKTLEWLAILFLSLSIVYITIQLIADCISGSMGLDTFNGKADPVVLRTMVEMTLLMFGSAGLIFIGTLLMIAAVLNHLSGMFKRWYTWVSVVVAILNYAFVPSMYFGTDPSRFYSTGGFGPALMATFPFLTWIVITGILMIRKQPISDHCQ
jgi:hypothetical protein